MIELRCYFCNKKFGEHSRDTQGVFEIVCTRCKKFNRYELTDIENPSIISAIELPESP